MESSWWGQSRVGIAFHASVASVPSWAPIGRDPSGYAGYLGEAPWSEPGESAAPLAEVLAHHRDRWGHVAGYDDFAELLTFHQFDAEAWAGLARDAGAGYAVATAKHHDGWTWWDAPGSVRCLTDIGPRRDVIGELAAACERNAVKLGAFLSMIDSAANPPDAGGTHTETLHAQATDLIERYGLAGLWTDGGWTAAADEWRGDELVRWLRAIDPDIVIDDGWGARRRLAGEGASEGPIIRSFSGQPPSEITAGPWELRRGVGRSPGFNRADGREDVLRSEQIIDIVTETVAKGGNVLFSVGPDVDGTIPAVLTTPLREAGAWLRAHGELLGRSQPWSEWGDRDVRYFLDASPDTSSSDDAQARASSLLAIDLRGAGRFRRLGNDQISVVDVDLIGAIDDQPSPRWSQDADGLHVVPTPGRSRDFPAVYRIELGEERERAALFDLDEPAPTPLAPLLAGVATGDIVQLGDGRYAGPAVVPPGVVLRGLGADRTSVVADLAVGITPTPATITLSRHARIEHLSIHGDDGVAVERRRPVVRSTEPFATVLGCNIDGSIDVAADDAIVRASTMRSITASDVDRLLVSRSTFGGGPGETAITVTGGIDHEIESCTIEGHGCGAHLIRTVGGVVRGSRLVTHRWGVRCETTERIHVHGNRVEGASRAIDVDGGSGASIDGNAVTGGDSGCLVQSGATGAIVAGNHWHGSRAGLICWSADPVHRDNVCVELVDPDAALITGP